METYLWLHLKKQFDSRRKYLKARNELQRKKRLHVLNALNQKKKIERLILLLSMRTIDRNIWKQDRTNFFWEIDVPNMNDRTFKENFRMNRSTFNILCTKLSCLKKADTVMRKAVTISKRIAIALYALGSSAEYRSVANVFGVGRTTVGQIVLEFCDAVWTILKPENINFFESVTPATVEECINGFGRLGFPQCIGAIDGCHIEVCPAKDEACDFYNFKGWYSTILLAVVDYRYRFTYIHVGAPGRVRDCYLYDVCSLKTLIQTSAVMRQASKSINGCEVPPLLIGDSAFALTPHMMKPFPFHNTMPEQQAVFNYKLSAARRVVENAFGHLKARFRKIGRGLEVHIDNTRQLIKATCVLHNFLNNLNDKINERWVDELKTYEASRNRQYPQHRTEQQEESGVEIRNHIAHFINSNQQTP